MKAIKFSRFNNGLIPLYGCDSEHLSKSDMSGTYYKAEDVEELVSVFEKLLRQHIVAKELRDFYRQEAGIQKFESHKDKR